MSGLLGTEWIIDILLPARRRHTGPVQGRGRHSRDFAIDTAPRAGDNDVAERVIAYCEQHHHGHQQRAVTGSPNSSFINKLIRAKLDHGHRDAYTFICFKCIGVRDSDRKSGTDRGHNIIDSYWIYDVDPDERRILQNSECGWKWW